MIIPFTNHRISILRGPAKIMLDDPHNVYSKIFAVSPKLGTHKQFRFELERPNYNEMEPLEKMALHRVYIIKSHMRWAYDRTSSFSLLQSAELLPKNVNLASTSCALCPLSQAYPLSSCRKDPVYSFPYLPLWCPLWCWKDSPLRQSTSAFNREVRGRVVLECRTMGRHSHCRDLQRGSTI